MIRHSSTRRDADHQTVVVGVGVAGAVTPLPSFQGAGWRQQDLHHLGVGFQFTYTTACIRDMSLCRGLFVASRKNHQCDKRDTPSPPGGKALPCGFAGRARQRDKGATKQNVSCHSATYTGGSLETPRVSRWVTRGKNQKVVIRKTPARWPGCAVTLVWSIKMGQAQGQLAFILVD